MRLELAIVQNCTPTGCLVQFLKGSLLTVNYSPLVHNRISIQRRQLVAVDTLVTPPQIVWRWVRTRVHELKQDTVVVDDGQATLIELVRIDTLNVRVNEGDEVWACGTGGDPELHDKVIDGQPSDPDRLLAYIQPIIETIYAA